MAGDDLKLCFHFQWAHQMCSSWNWSDLPPRWPWREKRERNKTKKHLPNHSFPPPPLNLSRLEKRWLTQRRAAGGVHHFSFFTLGCLVSAHSLALNWFPSGAVFFSFLPFFFSKIQLFVPVCYTCLPNSGADGRGWARCPNLCVDLPGKVEGRGTKGAGTLRTSHHKHIIPHVERSLHRERREFACDRSLKVWKYKKKKLAVHWFNLETY